MPRFGQRFAGSGARNRACRAKSVRHRTGGRRTLTARRGYALVEPVLGTGAFAVRGILFDKTRGANWDLLWHQDLSVAVRVNLSEPSGREVRLSQKGGVPHFDASDAALQRMLTLRFHLDDASEANGALRVLAGSHRQGRLSADAIEQAKRTGRIVCCSVKSGGIVAIRPLLLHSSTAPPIPFGDA